MSTVISVEHLSKTYRLGQIGTGTLTYDMKVWWAKMRGKPNPLLRIGETDHGNRDGETIWALKDVSFQVEQGEVLGIIGRNGAGKSTLLKILSRVTAPTSGRIKLEGRVASLLEVGTGFHPDLTGRENIYLNGAILGMSRKEIDRKFDEIVDFAELEKFIDTPVKRYSSGMYVRLAFAVAAHLEPEILVVDEVLAVGDAMFQQKCLGKMGDVAKEGRTVLFVSHNMAAIEALCTNGILFDAGELVLSGKANNIINSYLEENLSASVSASGSKGVYITDAYLQNSENKRTDIVKAGEDVSIVILVNLKDKELIHPQIGIGINSNYGQRLSTIGTNYSDSYISRLVGKSKIICKVPSLNLAPGQYVAKIALGNNGFDIEHLDNAVYFSVAPSNYFGNGKLPSANQGFLLLRSKWEIL